MLGVGAVALIAAAVRLGGVDMGMLSSQGFMAIMGASMFGLGALRLPGWARLRRKQMEEVAARVAAVASTQPMLGEPGKGQAR